jgi:GLPGLI family protein
MKNIFLGLLILFCFNSLFAQKSKEKSFTGSVLYNVTVQGEVDPNLASQLPTEIVTYYKEDKSRSEQKTAMGTAIVISDYATKSRFILFDMLGQKFAIKSTKEEIEKEQSEIPVGKLTYGTETKKIAGYECKKATFILDSKSYELYIASELSIPNSNWQTQFKDIQGVLLEYSQTVGENGEITMLISAKEVKKEKVKDSMFDVPSGYKEMTMSEFKKMMGGGEQ